MIIKKLSETVKSYDHAYSKDLFGMLAGEDRINKEEMFADLKKTNLEGKTVVAIIDKVIKNDDGSELFQYIGHNATTIGGTQTIVENTFDNLDPQHIMPLLNLDNAVLPDNWEYDKIEVAPSATATRKIFGCMLFSDGAVGQSIKMVNRRSKSFDLKAVLPFYRADSSLDDPVRYMNISTREINNELNTHADANVVRQMIDDGKYAMRVNIGSNDGIFNNCAYLCKLLKFNLTNIRIDGETIRDNEDSDKPSLDVRTKVSTRIKIDAGILTKSIEQNNGKDKADTRGMTLSAMALVAGRPAVVKVGEKLVRTYRDVIVTNRINFIEIPIESEELDFRYELYYV